MDLTNRPTGWGGATVSSPTLTKIQAAAERLRHIIVRTPLVPLHSFDNKTDIFQVYDDSSIPGADDYLIDADRSTLRPFGPELKAEGLSTG